VHTLKDLIYFVIYWAVILLYLEIVLKFWMTLKNDIWPIKKLHCTI